MNNLYRNDLPYMCMYLFYNEMSCRCRIESMHVDDALLSSVIHVEIMHFIF